MNDAAPALAPSPYPGLRPFRRDESALFFGRDACVDEMLHRLATTHFLAVLGPSGSGKSSLVGTGLIEALYTGALQGAGSRWQIAALRPAGRPLENLARALLRATGQAAPTPEAIADLTGFLWRGERAVEFWAGDGNVPVGTNLLILADQFEELFSHAGYAARDEAEGFVRRLIRAAQTQAGNIYVVLTMRSEYLGPCALFPDLAARINEGLYLTRRMTSEEMREAIIGPSYVAGFTIEPRLVDRIINDLAGFAVEESGGASALDSLARRADQLPLMQHALNQLYLHARAAAGPEGEIVLRADAYEALGSLAGALSAHGQRVLDSLGPDAAFAEPVFRALVEADAIATAVRRPARFATLVALAGGERRAVEAVVRAFAADGCDFLQTDPPGPLADDTVVEIRHESLIRQWDRLRDWTMAEAAQRAAYGELTRDAAKWRAAGQAMRRELERETAATWRDRPDPPPAWVARAGGAPADAAALLAASRRRAARAARRAGRQRLLAGLFALAMLPLIVTGAVVLLRGLPPVLWCTTIAAHLHDAKAADTLGRDYRNAIHVRANPALALLWYERAASQGDLIGESETAYGYYFGVGTPKPDYKRAVFWLQKAVAKDGTADNPASTKAVMMLGLAYETGNGVPQDAKKAVALYMTDATAGFSLAQFHLGRMYAIGSGVAQDYAKAVHWYGEAATGDAPDRDADRALGLLAEDGLGMPQSDAAAIAYFQKAGDADSQLQIGLIYEKQKDDKSALAAFQAAQAQGGQAFAADNSDTDDAYYAIVAAKHAGLLYADGDVVNDPAALATADGYYGAALALLNAAFKLNPSDPDALAQKAEILGDRAWNSLERGQFQNALDDMTQATSMLIQARAAASSSRQSAALGRAGTAPGAVIDVDPDYDWLRVNEADADMMLGQASAALAIYLNKRYDVADTGIGSSWRAGVLSDFATLLAGVPAMHVPPPIDSVTPEVRARILRVMAQVRGTFAAAPR